MEKRISVILCLAILSQAGEWIIFIYLQVFLTYSVGLDYNTGEDA